VSEETTFYTSYVTFHLISSYHFETKTAMNQILFGELQLSRKEKAAFTEVEQLPISVRVRLTGIHLSRSILRFDPEDSADADLTTVISDSLSSYREISFGTNSTLSNFFPLFTVFGVPYNEYNLSITLSGYDDVDVDAMESLSTASFRLRTIGSSFSAFELAFKYTLLFAFLFVLVFPGCGFGFCWKVCALPRGMRSAEQRWLLWLSVGLVFFNEPFVALKVKILIPVIYA
jgi:hypothetical protein